MTHKATDDDLHYSTGVGHTRRQSLMLKLIKTSKKIRCCLVKIWFTQELLFIRKIRPVLKMCCKIN